jgi:hypothetical protein
MILELHDNETGNTLTARISDIDYLYQAEQWVIDTYNEPEHQEVVRWELFDQLGGEKLRVWERPVGSTEMPIVTFPKSDSTLN